MSLNFRRPLGVAGDVKELEYISALHQTCDELRHDASIEATDVKHFLVSRYGIKVTDEEVRNVIFNGLAGGDGTSVCLDLAEIVAILIIPLFIKILRDKSTETEGIDKEHSFEKMNAHVTKIERADYEKIEADCKSMRYETIIEDVLNLILVYATGSNEPQPLTPDLLRRIFARFDELELIKDDNLVDEMIEMATGGDPHALLDVESFTRALTCDIMLYDCSKEARYSSHYDDVFECNEQDKDKDDDDDVELSASSDKDDIKKGISRIFTYPQVDLLSETFYSSAQVLFSFIFFIFLFATLVDTSYQVDADACQTNSIGCIISDGLVKWLIIMVTLLFLGGFIMAVFNLGNDPNHKSVYGTLISIVAIGFIGFYPRYASFDFGIIRKEFCNCPQEMIVHEILAYMASLLIFMKCLSLPRLLRFWPFTNKIFTILGRGSFTKDEFSIKQATVLKVHQMVKNAYSLHKEQTYGKTSTDLSQSYAKVLIKFNDASDRSEDTGGAFWYWKKYLTRVFYNTEGIRINVRLFIGLVSIFFMFAFLIAGGVVNSITLDKVLYNSINDFDEAKCPEFYPEECNWPALSNNYLGFAVCEFDRVGNDCFENFISWQTNSTNICYLYTSLTEKECNKDSIIITRANDDIYSFTFDSSRSEYCGAKMSFCVSFPPFIDKLTCFVGLDIINYDNNIFRYNIFTEYNGGCDNHHQIEQIMEVINSLRDDLFGLFIPSKWCVTLSITLAMLAAVWSLFYTSFMVIPSTISTTLKFRSGVLPSLRDPLFQRYRSNITMTSFVIGVMFWSAWIMTLLVCLLVFLFVFLLCWQVTRPVVISLSGMIIGIMITVLLKTLAVMILERYTMVAFYRTRPLHNNIMSLCLECWHIGISIYSVFIRLGKFMVMMAVFLGRIDRPMLAQDLKFDSFPIYFRQVILAAEAHRHPYIERLGLMYMMKLRYGEKFGKQSGSIWRLLFTFALMPWLRKYRIKDFDEDTDTIKSHNNMGGIKHLPQLLSKSESSAAIDVSDDLSDDLSESSEDNDEIDRPPQRVSQMLSTSKEINLQSQAKNEFSDCLSGSQFLTLNSSNNDPRSQFLTLNSSNAKSEDEIEFADCLSGSQFLVKSETIDLHSETEIESPNSMRKML